MKTKVTGGALALVLCWVLTTAFAQSGPIAESPFFTLHIEKSGGLFGCMAVATEVGIVTASHCVEVGAEMTLIDEDGSRWPAKLLWVTGEIALLRSDVRVEPLMLAPIAHDQEIHAWTQSGMVTGVVRVFEVSGYKVGAISTIEATFGDSGGAVLDGEGRLVGIVVGGNAFGSTVIEPLPVDLMVSHWGAN